MSNLQDYVKVYKGAISPELCQSLINKFDQAEIENHDNELFRFDQIVLNQCSAYEEEVKFELYPLMKHYVQKYISSLKIEYFPEKFGWEELRIKKYPKDGYFKEHVDVRDYASARRFLSMFVYLNESGGTKFGDRTIKPEQGTLVIFPPLWMYPHTGIVGKTEKYFLSTYLHYL